MKQFILDRIKEQKIFTDYAIPVANFSDNEFTLSTEKLEAVMIIRLSQSVNFMEHMGGEGSGFDRWEEPHTIDTFMDIIDIYNEVGSNVTKTFSKKGLIEIEKALQTMIESMQLNGSLPIQENTLL